MSGSVNMLGHSYKPLMRPNLSFVLLQRVIPVIPRLKVLQD